jgi:hypothetical protein
MTKEAQSRNDQETMSLFASSFNHSSFLRALSFGIRHFGFRSELTTGRVRPAGGPDWRFSSFEFVRPL